MELADYRVANPRQMIIVIAPGCLERAFHTQQRGGSKKGGISFRLTNNFSLMKFPLSSIAYACSVFTIVLFAFELATISVQQDTVNALFIVVGFIFSFVGPLAMRFHSLIALNVYTVFTILYWIGDFVISILTIYLKTFEISNESFSACMDIRFDQQAVLLINS